MLKFTAIAPAKINLHLRVFPKSEGEKFHSVENIMQTLTLHDKLTFLVPENDEDFEQVRSIRNRKINDCYGIKEANAQHYEKDDLSVSLLVDDHTDQNLQIPIDRNLITRALQASFNRTQKTHVEVLLKKNIPAQGGLAGGSSDAAATLQMAKKCWGVNDGKIARIAACLGSDVPYFLTGGRAKMLETGTELAEKLPSLKSPVVLVKPESGVSTKECYAKFDEMQNKALPKGEFGLLNDLQKPACSMEPSIRTTIKLLEENCEPENVLMSGSGSACFAICDTFEQARNVTTIATKEGLWARACSCANVKASLID